MKTASFEKNEHLIKLFPREQLNSFQEAVCLGQDLGLEMTMLLHKSCSEGDKRKMPNLF